MKKSPKSDSNRYSKRKPNGPLEPSGLDNILHDEWQEYNRQSYGNNEYTNLKALPKPHAGDSKSNPDKAKDGT